MVTLFLPYMVGYTRLVRFPSSYCFSMFFHPCFKRAACFALVNLDFQFLIQRLSRLGHVQQSWTKMYQFLGLLNLSSYSRFSLTIRGSQIVFSSILGLLRRLLCPSMWAVSLTFPHFPVGLTVYYFNFIPEGAMVTLFLPYMVGYTRLVRFPSSYCFSMFFHPCFKRAACFALVNLAAAAWDGVYAVLGLVLLCRYLLSVLGVVDSVRFHVWHCMGDGSRS